MTLRHTATYCDLNQHRAKPLTSHSANQWYVFLLLLCHLWLVSYLELHDPALVGNNVMCDSIHLSPISIATHHYSIRRAAETLHGAIL